MNSPFIFGKLAIGQSFINREEEKKRLKNNILGSNNTMLISPRRWGKSSLVRMVAKEVEKERSDVHFCFIDMFNVRTEEEFFELFATEVLKTTSHKWEEWAENGKQFIRTLFPRFSFGIDPQNDFTISLDFKQLKKSANEILNLPEEIAKKKNIKIVVCIDEFQNISFFDEPLALQKKLRSVWQNQSETTYCLYGSKRHMMTDIFENKSMPFYKFGDTIFLNKIDEKYWLKYIPLQFKRTGKRINKKLAQQIAQISENHPYYVQLFSNIVWQKTDGNCTDEIVEFALNDLLLQSSILFQRETDNLSNTQVNFLKALVDGVVQFSSKETLSTYNLGSQGNIKKIKTALESKEVIDLWGSKIEFLDPIFKIWFETTYMK